MRLRTVPKAVALLREEDPDTPLSEKIMHRIREVIDITSGQYGSGTFKAFFNQE